MDSKIAYNTRIYADLQGLKQLQYEKNTDAAKKEVSQQFESLLMQMVLHSMRDANKSFSSGLFGSSQMDLYQDMFDKQLSLMLPKSGLGFAEIVEKNIDQMQNAKPLPDNNVAAPTFTQPQKITPAVNHPAVRPAVLPLQEKSTTQMTFDSPEDFIKKLWPSAKLAASFIGASPAILLAQAALETNWGKSILPQGKSGSSYNLFNIKAGSSWTNKTTTVASLEQRNGVLVKEKSDFRSYDSYDESFLDYINLLRQNERYSDALNKANNPEQFTHALQNAGYATDENYAKKVMDIFSSQNFKSLIASIK